MRTALRRLAASLALAAAALPQSATAQTDTRGIVFAAELGEDGNATLEPIAIISAGVFDRPDSDPDADPFATLRTQWLRPGERYDLLSRGERIGTTTLAHSEISTDGCQIVAGYGSPRVRAPLPDGWRGLAGKGLTDQPNAPWLRETTAAERRALDGMAAALLAAHGIGVADYTQGDTVVSTLLYHPNARPVLVGRYNLARDDQEGRQVSVFIVAEEGQDGYRPTYAWIDEGGEGDVESRELVDAADLDGDGRPELVVRNLFYESWTFSILQRGTERWSEAYTGGGGGC